MTGNVVCTDERLHWAIGVSQAPLVDIVTFVRSAIARAKKAIPSRLRRHLAINVDDLCEGYKVSAGRALLSTNIDDQYIDAATLSATIHRILSDLNQIGIDSSIVICKHGNATAAITSCATNGFVLIQDSDDFDPARPLVASSLRGAQAIAIDEMPKTLARILHNVSTSRNDRKSKAGTPSQEKEQTRRALLRSKGGALALQEGDKALSEDRKTRLDTAERLRHLASESFLAELTDSIGQTVKAAVARHHQAGYSVHGERDGVIVEIPPPTRT